MSSFPDSLGELSPDSHPTESTHPFDDDNSYVGGYAPPPYSDFADPESVKESISDSPVINNVGDDDAAFGSDDGIFGSDPVPIYGYESNGDPPVNRVFVESNGPILPPPSEMQEEGFALREWRRENAILLEQKEMREKEILNQIIEEANEYKSAFHEKRKVTCENNKTNNREKEKLFLDNQKKFHAEADKNYWKTIAELIPNEVPAIEKKRGKKEKETKPSIVVVQGPKPGKPTELARMRQILVKLKHTTPAHLNLTPQPAVTPTKDGHNGGAAAVSPKSATGLATPGAVVVA